MAGLVFGMNVSLDGYVDKDKFAPDATLFRPWMEQVDSLTGSVYARVMYEIMQYWDDDHADLSLEKRDFAA